MHTQRRTLSHPTWILSLIGVSFLALQSMASAAKPFKRFQNVAIEYQLIVGESFTVKGDKGVSFLTDQLLEESIPIQSEAGSLFYWIPSHGALRFGYYIEGVNESPGLLSFAGGEGSIATGMGSWSYGVFSEAGGVVSFAFGFEAEAKGNESIALGSYSYATGLAGLALGSLSTNHADGGLAVDGGVVYGDRAMAFGYSTVANAYQSVAFGQFNVGAVTEILDDNGNPIPEEDGRHQWIETDPLFEIGMGTSDEDLRNAVTVLKNGYVGIGTTEPQAHLHVMGAVTIEGPLKLLPQGDIPMMDYQ